ncbi:MAG TPA: hypothetical protein VNN07_02440 [Candidatus Tectomicrobia bacterium]|nr:hypothetical protein [Candidatus Tectomicrobia bacterium]
MAPAGAGTPLAVSAVSVVVGIAGIIATRAWIARSRDARDSPHLSWSLGILAVLPAWLVAFVYLIPPGSDVRAHRAGAVVWVCSIALGLTGAIVSEARLRQLHESAGGLAPARAWFLGLAAMTPAWIAMLLGLLVEFLAA